MSRYEVSASMFLDRNPTDCIEVKETAIHPDLAKQALYKKYPKRSMKGIVILDVTPVRKLWSDL